MDDDNRILRFDAAGKPVDKDGKVKAPHQWLARTTTLCIEGLQRKPVPREMICDYFPAKASSAVVAMGGVGKTTWTAHRVMPFLSDDLHVMFVSAEDGEEDYHAKVHNLIFTNGDIDAESVADKIHILNLKGDGIKLISDLGGSFIPSEATNELITLLQEEYPKVRLVVFETVSRFAGGEDNDRMEALVTATDRIAIAINGASALIHHMGKSQGREKVIDLYSGRGGSALGDNTRSMIVLTRLDDDYMGALPVVVSRDDLEAGRVFEVFHVRNSYGPTNTPEYYITRSGYCYGPVLEPVPIATDADITKQRLQAIQARYNKAATELHTIIKQEGGWVKKRYFDSNTKQLIGLTQKEGRELITEMLDAGSLAEEDKKSDAGQMQSGLVIKHQNKGVSA